MTRRFQGGDSRLIPLEGGIPDIELKQSLTCLHAVLRPVVSISGQTISKMDYRSKQSLF